MYFLTQHEARHPQLLGKKFFTFFIVNSNIFLTFVMRNQ